MGANDRIPKYNLSKGLDRKSSSLTRDPDKLFDICNLLPRSPLGVETIKGTTIVNQTTIGTIYDILPADRGNNNILALVARTASTYIDLIGNNLPTITFKTTSNHKLSAYRGQIAIAQQGERIQLLNLASITPTAESLSESPKGSFAVEYKSCLWAGGETEDDDSAPIINIPLYGVIIPPPSPIEETSGTANITALPAEGIARIKSTTGNFTNCVGKIIMIHGEGYSIKQVTTTDNTNDTAIVDLINGQPQTENSVAYTVYAGGLVLALPTAINFGSVYLFNDSGKALVKVFNTGTDPVKITGVKSASPQIRIEDLTTLPYTIPAGSSFSFSAIYVPETEGTNQADIQIEHDFYGQSTISIPCTCNGTLREVLAYPSVVGFGGWVAGADSPYMTIEIKNPLKDDIYIDVDKCTFTNVGTGYDFKLAETFPTQDVLIKANESYKLQVKFTPSAGKTGVCTGNIGIKRYVPAKPYRLWRSHPAQASKWNRDREWIDLSADSLAGGQLRAAESYADSIVVFKDASVWLIVPGGLETGYRPVQLAFGEGIGAVSAQAVCKGAGSLFWASKQGVFRMTDQSISIISEPIEDIYNNISPTDYDKIRMTFYKDMLILLLPASTYYPSQLWAYATNFPSSEGSWWRLDYAPSCIIVDKGAKRKESLYATFTKLYKLDDAESTVINWMMETPIVGGEVDVVKKLTRVNIQVSNPEDIINVFAIGSNKATAYGKLYSKYFEGTSFAGIGYFNYQDNTLTINNNKYSSQQLQGKIITIAGEANEIDSVEDNVITLKYETSITRNRYVSYVVNTIDTHNELNQAVAIFPENAVANHFRIIINGSSQYSLKSHIAGLSVFIEPISMETTKGE